MSVIPFILYKAKLGSGRGKPRFNLQLWNVYERVIGDLARSNNVVEGWHWTFNNRVSIKHPSITKLAICILHEQVRFKTDIERLRPDEQPSKKKKIYQNPDARLKRIVLSYDVTNIDEYNNSNCYELENRSMNILNVLCNNSLININGKHWGRNIHRAIYKGTNCK